MKSEKKPLLQSESKLIVEDSSDNAIYQILLIEDNKMDSILFKILLEEIHDFNFQLTVTERLKEGIEQLHRLEVNVIFLDLNLPDSNGLSTLQEILKVEDNIPVVVMTGLADENLGLQAIQKGAQDYLIKGQVSADFLKRVIRYSMQRKHSERMVKASLKEKEMLLKEVHHRVKNNLHVICSLLSLQSDYIKDPEDFEMFKESQNRIRSMAMIHERLYQSKNFSQIDFSEYIRYLSKDLLNVYEISPDKIKLVIDIDDVQLGINQAVPCGLIINELLTNALKYAFPPSFSENPTITIRIHQLSQNLVEMIIQDNGAGFPIEIDIHTIESLGLNLVVILTEEQLEGKIHLERSKGTKFIIQFTVS